ncbi:unnamed protein product [Didymodactylos carnosus]|uniref:CCHC-type domain-containing protein n=1 Tax=Didymodactylos carnosus TaxID=1234261 RepID=A0A815F5Z4_9BILA|nr:unnamed protein product [Didymodactylos carnosus]CAF4168273.1 unnamed protein product [Didymodactylos carnosus]
MILICQKRPCYHIQGFFFDVPPQWKAEDFGEELKIQYPSIVKAGRLYIRGGRRISKVRLDFSSNQHLPEILKRKNIVLDDDNTSYRIEPYIPPTRVLRCYVCQEYGGHTAANCSKKDNPICFKCGQSHEYNPRCESAVCCANCQEPHMAGNPQCRVKIEQRQKLYDERRARSIAVTAPPNVWTNRTTGVVPALSTAATTSAVQSDSIPLLEKINEQMTKCIEQQLRLETKIENKLCELEIKIDQNCNEVQREVREVTFYVHHVLSPLVHEIAEYIYDSLDNSNEQKTFLNVLDNFVDFRKQLTTLSTLMPKSSKTISNTRRSSMFTQQRMQ